MNPVKDETYTLQMQNIEKEYYGNKVLKGINLALRPGEVLALVGENGAGKSTLMNILFGMPVIHSTGGFLGKVYFEGKETHIKSPYQAMELGIGMVHQEFMLLPSFTITENIKLNREYTKPNLISRVCGKKMEILDYKRMTADAKRDLEKVGMTVSEGELVEGLPVGFMQFVEIAREIDKKDIKMIVFDEPTAVLTETESQRLLETIKTISGDGVSVIFISHKLDEIIQAADTIMVMRDGEHVATVDKKDTDVMKLAELMVGRGIDAGQIAKKRDFSKAPTVMSIKNLKVRMPGERVKGVTVDVKKGEILGFGGLAGQGKIGISNGILGLYPTEGEVTYEGEALKLNQPLDSLKRKIAFVSEDRKEVGLLLTESIEDNITIAATRVNRKYLKKYGIFTQIDKKAQKAQAESMIKELQIKCTSPKQPVGALSGGNQQKVCVARALTLEPDILFVSEPTRGIDIGAKQVLLDYLKKLNREEHMTIVVTSSELKELRSICDRIAIITDGKVEGILPPDASDVDFGLMMSGQYHKVYGKEGQK